jgi:hypothetical protein
MSVCFLAFSQATGDLNGKWIGLLKTDEGKEFSLLYNFKIQGNQLVGTANTPDGERPINDGKIKGADFTFNVAIGKMVIEHSGKFYGDSVGVDLSLGDQSSHATLKREE